MKLIVTAYKGIGNPFCEKYFCYCEFLTTIKGLNPGFDAGTMTLSLN
ncbi:hypothetical protein [Fructilactobacillus carniphilus]|uniref:Uncharacterized protein n=1 Tax=Fructilactobacillus carniphilus TaxID=2940297 RepID=A0ABY5BVE1_9LACO|nr:hypothetical protein [Fructilactobacillus carniphilus]USS90471.1 hypothetical protein M3M37_06435 [Fructilactobacillus carniphilus]